MSKLFPSCLCMILLRDQPVRLGTTLNLAMQKPPGKLPSLSVESDFHPCCFIAKANICIEKQTTKKISLVCCPPGEECNNKKWGKPRYASLKHPSSKYNIILVKEVFWGLSSNLKGEEFSCTYFISLKYATWFTTRLGELQQIQPFSVPVFEICFRLLSNVRNMKTLGCGFSSECEYIKL